MREVDDLELRVHAGHHLGVLIDDLTLAESLLDQARRSVFFLLLVLVLRHKVRVPAKKLTGRGDDACRVLGTANLQVLTVNLDLLEYEGLCGLFSRAEISEGVVTFTRDPAADNWVTILENPDALAEFLESGIQ